MTERNTVAIAGLRTGSAGLDAVLDGGLPQYSLNLIAGAPGTGKTTLAHQIMFANASRERPALYFTVVGEPPVKMLRYQQQFSFFDPDKVAEGAIRFVNLTHLALADDLNGVLETMLRETETVSPGIVVVDSFRTVMPSLAVDGSATQLQSFVRSLAVNLTTAQATTFLVGEYGEQEDQYNPVFTVADGILWLFQSVLGNSMVRKIQIMKMRGRATMSGLHTLRIARDGIEVFPRVPRPFQQKRRLEVDHRRLSVGVPEVDEMLGGGIPEGDSMLVAGPTGSGKTLLSTSFINEGFRQGEPGVIVVFEEHPSAYLDRARRLGFELEEMIHQDKLSVIYLRPLDLSVDETLEAIREAVEAVDAQRVVIDSLSGFELALAPTFREDFRESMYRLVGSLTGVGVTVLLTVEVAEFLNELHLSPDVVSFLTDDIILLRYAEIDSQLKRMMTVIKMRRSAHSKDIRSYEITSTGLVLGETLKGYQGLITGTPTPLRKEPKVSALG
jgi:circadian clock protein KaiC